MAVAAAIEAGAELAACLSSGETLMEADAQRLMASLRGAPSEGNASLLSPQLVAELLDLLSGHQEAATPDSGDQPGRLRRVSCEGPRSSGDTQSLSNPCGRRRRRCCGRSHGYSHEHRHGHSHCNVHEAGQDDEHEPESEPSGDFSEASVAANT